ncbi:hypothetical protein PVAP13_5KG545756 [Panicum virgatum]|uniref:Uncharacterized protein n=1 Tax=Panicum virgatum TaxID=38727 RepID=A0A8T0SV83_PANVG|nr:hypothetical protein PVAP13_5KG545756 [Panicum virgatum]
MLASSPAAHPSKQRRSRADSFLPRCFLSSSVRPKKMAAGQLKAKILAAAAAAVVVASSLVGTASAADAPALAPTSGATAAAPAFAAVSVAVSAFGYLFC